MTSLFADQFGYRTPYGLGPLDTGVPSIGIRLPQGESKTPVGENTGSNVTSGGSAAANAAAGASEGLIAGQDTGQSGTVGQAGVNAAARQGTLNKLNAMAREDQANGDNAASSTGSVSAPQTGSMTGADPNIPSPEWGMHQPKVTPQTYINRTSTSPTSLPAGTHPVSVPGGGTEWVTGNSAPPTSQQSLPSVFQGGHVGSPGIWDLVKGTAGQLGHDLGVAGHDWAVTFQNQNSFGQKDFQVPNTPGGYSTSTGSAGTIAQHGQPWSAYTNKPGTGSGYTPGVSSPNYDVGIGEGPSNYGGYGQAAANDVGNDASHINWAQFFRSAANDFGEEGG